MLLAEKYSSWQRWSQKIILYCVAFADEAVLVFLSLDVRSLIFEEEVVSYV